MVTSSVAGHLYLPDFFLWHAGGGEGLKSLFNAAVLCIQIFTCAGVWRAACGPTCSLPLERRGLQELKKNPKDLFYIHLRFPAPAEKFSTSIPRVVSKALFFACLHLVTARFPKILGLFPAHTMWESWGWQSRAPGQTQLGAQCGNYVLPSCFSLPICKSAVPSHFQK